MSTLPVKTAFQYYMALGKRFISECYRSWRTELLSTVGLAIIVFILGKGSDASAKTAFILTMKAAGILLAVWAVIRLVQTPWKLHQEVSLELDAARSDAQEAQNREAGLRDTIAAEKEQPASSVHDPWMSLLQKRQRLEAELQPLVETEECGIKVVPAIKIGKDDSDYRREKIARLRRDIEDINKQLSLPAPSAIVRLIGSRSVPQVEVTNNGAGAEFYATMEIHGSVIGPTSGIFAKWSHSEAVRTWIAKGQSCQLSIASLKSTVQGLFHRWEITALLKDASVTRFLAGQSSSNIVIPPNS